MIYLEFQIFKVCTANPITSEQQFDPAKVFSADELQRAKDVGLPVRRLAEGHEYGLTLEQIIKFHELPRPPRPENATLEQMVSCAYIKNENETLLKVISFFRS